MSKSQDTQSRESKAAPKKIAILIIDPQNDFHEEGSLAVAGSGEDAKRIAELIRAKLGDIDAIFVTLDSHHKIHVAHGVAWQDRGGRHPTPFTIISGADAEQGVWEAVDPNRREIFKKYAKDLEAKGRFKVCIWPEHCLIGTTGHAVTPAINDALQGWSGANNKRVEYVRKGENLDTEMYSAIAAEIPVPSDTSTHTNHKLLKKLNDFDAVIICGQALSHCVNFTTRDIVAHWEGDRSGLIVLSDCSSAVGGFQDSADEFLKFCRAEGVHVTDSKTLLSEWDVRTPVRARPAVRTAGENSFFSFFNTWLPIF